MPATPEEVLNKILEGLRSDQSERRLATLHELETLSYSSAAILERLERMALSDPSKPVRALALSVLSSPVHRHVQEKLSSLPRNVRGSILDEIASWEEDGLIQAEQVSVLRRRYDFDSAPPESLQPSPALTTRVIAPSPEAPNTAAAPAPSGPRPTLTQTLLSEASIRIALYLGAFFVISAALILAALVAAARLPILGAATAIFAGVSLAIRRRLPQPSFALYIVFSFLLPITANVLEESLRLGVTANSFYWIFVSLAMAAVWIFSAWVYESRLFTVTAFLALDSGFLNIADLVSRGTESRPEVYLPIMSVAALAGLAGVALIRRWKDIKFAYPLFALGQIQQAAILWLTAGAVFLLLVLEDSLLGDHSLPYALVFGLAAAFYVWSNRLAAFSLFPWLTAVVLIPVSWLLVQPFDPQPVVNIAAIGVWGLILALASEPLFRFAGWRNYSLPLLVASIVLFVAASIWGIAEDVRYGFTCLAATSVAYAALHILRPRKWLWAASLTAAIATYFVYFDLPFMRNVDLFFGYKFLIPGLILLTPDVFLKPDFRHRPDWRLPLRVWGSLLTSLNILLLLLLLSPEPRDTALVFAVYTLFFAGYALRYRRASLGFIATASAALSTIFLLDYLDQDLWLPVLTGLAVVYFASGLALRSRQDWSAMLRNSALILGTLVSLAALIGLEERGGWYAIVVGLLFAAEMYLRRDGRLEFGPTSMFGIAAYLILHDFHVEETGYLLLTLTLILLGADAVLLRTFTAARPLAPLTRALGGVLAGANTLYLVFAGIEPLRVPWICFTISTAFFGAYAWLHRRPELGYSATLYLALAVLFLNRDLDRTDWLYPTVTLSILYYAIGYALRRLGRASGWDSTVLISGLVLGTVASLFAPLQGGLAASIPVALVATTWAVEAFGRRNVWLGFPANGLYLLAYFIVLFELKVDEPQFFSMGAALLGILMHYLLTRAGGKAGAFVTGMASQLVLLGTTYIQMLSTGKLTFFVVLFLQSLAVLAYGLVIRSRSLVFTPIAFAILGVVTVIYSTLKGLSTVLLIGCTGIVLLLLGIVAVVMRERITRLGERLSDWQA